MQPSQQTVAAWTTGSVWRHCSMKCAGQGLSPECHQLQCGHLSLLEGFVIKDLKAQGCESKDLGSRTWDLGMISFNDAISQRART
eukprot:2281339-Karenia_brevis.AAC.1